jgi:hypothetical protein
MYTVRTCRHRALGALLWVALVAAPIQASPCEPWPGEPEPLPTTTDADPLRAQWAELRVLELVRAASAFEPRDPAQAQRLLNRVLCFDPGSDGAHRALARLSLVQVHRPEVVRGTPSDAVRLDAWASLDRAIVMNTRRSPQPRPDAAIARADARLETLAGQLKAARFDDALATAAEARRDVRSLPAGERPARTVRLEVMTATAQLALGRDEDARASFERALDADPALALDPGVTSPKVLRALEGARLAREGRP